jgi:hypothetical protein
MNKQKKSPKIHFGGMPTGPDVRKLCDAFADLKVGATILYSDVSAVIGVPYPSNRWNSVVDAWRKHLLGQETNLDLARIAGTHLLVLSAPQRVDKGSENVRRRVRAIRRDANRVANVPTAELDDISKRRRDHVLQRAAILLDADRDGKKVDPPEQTRILPRLVASRP